MRWGDVGVAAEIRDGTGDFEEAVVGAGAPRGYPAQLLDGGAEQGLSATTGEQNSLSCRHGFILQRLIGILDLRNSAEVDQIGRVALL